MRLFFIRLFKFVIALAIPLSVGMFAWVLIQDSIKDWYPTLTTLTIPFFHPPAYIFAPVWSVPYITMGISLYLVLIAEPGVLRSRAILVFGLQLILNFWWSMFFFIFRHPEVAMVTTICLWFSIVWMMSIFRRLSPLSAYLQIPYLFWVAFAGTMNAAIWISN